MLGHHRKNRQNSPFKSLKISVFRITFRSLGGKKMKAEKMRFPLAGAVYSARQCISSKTILFIFSSANPTQNWLLKEGGCHKYSPRLESSHKLYHLTTT
jgi:hypothetical protein